MNQSHLVTKLSRSLPPLPPALTKTTEVRTDSSQLLCLSATPLEIERALEDIRIKKQVLSDEIVHLQSEISLCTAEIDLLEGNDFGDDTLEEDNRSSQLRSKIMYTGQRMFNSNPSEGIQFLLSNQLVANNPDDIAQLLYNDPKFGKTAIGNYLGTKDDFILKVLNSFTALQDFHEILLVEALRRFLSSFRLPGEGQKIDRMMQAFSEHYYKCNPNVMPDAGTIHLLSYAIVILNTSLHNKNVAKNSKINLDEFVRMVNTGLSTGKDVADIHDIPISMLQSIYDNVRRRPFKLPEEEIAVSGVSRQMAEIFFNPDKEGWMYKLGGNFRTWKRRWFILTGCCLYYFEFTTDRTPRGIIPLSGGLTIRNTLDASKPHCFEIYPLDTKNRIRARKTNEIGKCTEGNHSFYRFSAPSHIEKTEWMHLLCGAMENVCIEAQAGGFGF